MGTNMQDALNGIQVLISICEFHVRCSWLLSHLRSRRFASSAWGAKLSEAKIGIVQSPVTGFILKHGPANEHRNAGL